MSTPADPYAEIRGRIDSLLAPVGGPPWWLRYGERVDGGYAGVLRDGDEWRWAAYERGRCTLDHRSTDPADVVHHAVVDAASWMLDHRPGTAGRARTLFRSRSSDWRTRRARRYADHRALLRRIDRATADRWERENRDVLVELGLLGPRNDGRET